MNRASAATAATVLLALAALAASSCSSAPPKPPPPPPKYVAKTIEMSFDGPPEQVVPQVVRYLRSSPIFTDVKTDKDNDTVTAALNHIPGLDLVVDMTDYFLQVDVKKTEGTCKVIFEIYRLNRALDEIAARALIGLLEQTVGGVIKAGLHLH